MVRSRKDPDYPESIPSPESGRPMFRGEKPISFTIDGRSFTYLQPGWWCAPNDPDDMEGEFVDEDNRVAETAWRSAKALMRGETIFVPAVIRAIRLNCGLTLRQAGWRFGSGERSFERYEIGDIEPTLPLKRLLDVAMRRPDLFPRPRGLHWQARYDPNQLIIDAGEIRAMRKASGLSQSEADAVFGAPEGEFAKFESGEVAPEGTLRQAIELAIHHPEAFRKQKKVGGRAAQESDYERVRKALCDAKMDRYFLSLFTKSDKRDKKA